MKLRKEWTMSWLNPYISLLSSALFISSCATVPNVEVCGKLQDGAACAFMVDGPRTRMTEAEFQAMVQPGMFFFKSFDGYAEIREYIERKCVRDPRCRIADVKKIFNNLEDKILDDENLARQILREEMERQSHEDNSRLP